MAVSRVAIQAATTQLPIGTVFADSNGLLTSASGVKVGSFTRDKSLATGTQAVTGVGFKPVALIFLAGVNVSSEFSIGLDDGTNHRCIADYHVNQTDKWAVVDSISIYDVQGAGAVEYAGYVSSLDSDGFTIQWTKYNGTSGTLTVFYLALR